jgi:UvrD-like helicase family protein
VQTQVGLSAGVGKAPSARLDCLSFRGTSEIQHRHRGRFSLSADRQTLASLTIVPLQRSRRGTRQGDIAVIEAHPSWTPEQLSVIEAPHAARLIVDAGPGTGKTATLCGRIAWLIESAGLEPGEIWIISFTRTAVAEIRDRVSTYLSDPDSAYGIRVATIDSHAWAMNIGFNEDPVLSGDFDDNIKRVIDIVRTNEHAVEYINSVKHLFIDEAQDVVGPRVEFVLELIHAMPATAGVTVLCDEAQAIYDYSENDDCDDLSGTLASNIREFMPDFEDLQLVEIHRTADPALKDLFLRGRASIKDASLRGRAKYVEVRKIVVNCSHEKVGDAVDDLDGIDYEQEDVFLLFRRRGEALAGSARMGRNPHRLRMSGLPTVIDEWIGLVFWDWLNATISREAFYDRWPRRIPMGGIAKDIAWSRLVRIAGKSDSIVDVRKLRHRLASMSPPLEVSRPEFGSHGPVIGTIHASKGREASEVRLYLPRSDSMRSESELGFEGEAKILFVGATRAKHRLLVGHSFMSYSSRLSFSGRAYTRCANPPWAAQVEIGRASDFVVEGLTGKKYYADPLFAKRAQNLIAGLRRGIHFASARLGDKDSGYCYGVSVDALPNQRIVTLDRSVNSDLFLVARNLRRKYPPSRLSNLRTLGARTVAVSPDDPVGSALHHPWSESGFMLAPLLIGYSTLEFR